MEGNARTWFTPKQKAELDRKKAPDFSAAFLFAV
jgi:hypothetical protein